MGESDGSLRDHIEIQSQINKPSNFT